VTVAVVVGPGKAPPDEIELIAEMASLRVADNAQALARALEGAEILFAWGFRSQLLVAAWPHATSLRWIHAASTGVDALLVDPVAASDVVVTNTRGVFERPIAEYVLALILAFAKDLPRTLGFQRERRWVYRTTETIEGRPILILGAGGVARELAPLLRSAGMEVQVVGRTARDDPVLGRVAGSNDVDSLLPGVDFVVLALPLTSETKGYLGVRRIGLLHPGARLINVGRGALVDENALLRALRRGHIAGAALDVFAEEPLPPRHPLWAMEQVIVSPHMSGDSRGWERAVVERFRENLRRWLAGEDLLNVVDKRLAAGPAPTETESAAQP
jgi:phosphoglycerate dehydrogenase-like enzyme